MPHSLTSLLMLGLTLSTMASAGIIIPRSSSSLAMLNPLMSASVLTCRSSADTISCYGGKPATAATCRSVCSCDISNTVTCRAYSNCDDNSMDHFCAGFCQCPSRSALSLGGEGGKIKLSKKHRHSYASEDDGISITKQH